MHVRGFARIIVCGVAAATTLIIFAVTALKDQTATSATAGALCLAFAILSVLDLESFEGLGIKAKLRNTLSDAERRLEGIDKIIGTLAQQAFTHASSGNVDMYDGKVMIEELTISLKAMDFSPEKIEELKSQSYKTIGVYLWNIYKYIVNQLMSSKLDELTIQEINCANIDLKKVISEKMSIISRTNYFYDYNVDYKDFRKQLNGNIEKVPFLSREEKAILTEISSNISDIYEACLKSGGYTNDAIQTIKKMESGYHNFMADKVEELYKKSTLNLSQTVA